MLKKSCPNCGSVVELDETKYFPGIDVTTQCQLCGTSVEFEIPEPNAAPVGAPKSVAPKSVAPKSVAPKAAPAVNPCHIPSASTAQSEATVPPVPKPAVTPPTPPAPPTPASSPTVLPVNSQPQVPRVLPDPVPAAKVPQPSGNNNRRMAVIIAAAAFVLMGLGALLYYIFVGKSDSSSVDRYADDSDMEMVEESAYTADSPSAPSDYAESYQECDVTSSCSPRPMSDRYDDAYMLIPDYLSYYRTDSNGSRIYKAPNNSLLMTWVGQSDKSPESIVSEVCRDYHSTYSAGKSDWAVNSGSYPGHIYYAKARRVRSLVYFAFYAIPDHESQNAATYREFTNTIFKNTSFPYQASSQDYEYSAGKSNPTLESLIADSYARLTHEDISGLDSNELRILRNSYYARNGYIFKDQELAAYFSRYDWYHPVSRNVDNKLTETQKSNINLIKSHE